MKLKITFLLFLTTLFISRTTAQCGDAQFAEINGIAVIEAESPSLPSGWNRETASTPFTGGSYIAWRGADSFNTPGNGTINYRVRINSAGTYRFQWRSKVGIIAATNPSTEHNDSWLKIQASDFFGMKNGQRIYPKGSGKSPTALGAGGAGWFKIYLSGTTNWTWSSFTSDNQSYPVYATFNSPGVYTIQVSGRSRGHFIDRMVLYKEANYTAAQAQSLSRAQTNCGGGTPPPPPPPPSGSPVVNSFSYINAGNDNVIGTLNNGAQINIANVTSNLSFRANANSNTQSVRLQLTGPVSNTRNDNNVPYSIFGDSGGNYTGRTMQVGNYTLTATPYAQDNLGGAQGTANTISFSIVNSGTPPPPPPPSGNNVVTGFTLVNANNNSNIGAITQGRNFSNLPSSLNIRANTNPSSVGFVRFTLTGPINTTKSEGAAPYHVFGDIGVNPIGRSMPNGNYTITAIPRNGTALTVNFSIGGASSTGKSAVIQEVYVYPNPVKDGRFSVKMPEEVIGEVHYTLISSTGAAIETGKLDIKRAGENAEFNLNSFNQKNAGIYYLILQSNQARYTLPVMKK